MEFQVSALTVYPIKSCAGISLAMAEIVERGIRYDRQWMVVDEAGVFITQRQMPNMALIKTELDDAGRCLLSAPGMLPIVVADNQDGVRKTAQVWSDKCEVIDQGDQIALWFSAFLQVPCRLVSMCEDFARAVDRKYAERDSDQVGFADGFPFLLISEASLADLNRRMEAPLPMNRFRPNIVVSNCPPYAEDLWRKLRIGSVEFNVVKACSRCVITTTNQQTAEVGKEPLRTLATYRRVNGQVLFGQNLTHANNGVIAVGDVVRVLF